MTRSTPPTGPAEPAEAGENSNDGTSGEQKPLSIADRWWWSGAFRAVIGSIIAYLQWDPISQGQANWMNWVMVAAGAAVAIWGITELIRDYGKQTGNGAQ